MSRFVVGFLNDLEARCAAEEIATATGFLLEVIAGDYRMVHGPFPKDVAVFEAIERLTAEEDPETDPNVYNVMLLQPTWQTFVHPKYPEHLYADRCICNGVKHWHAPAPYGCDECDCTEFRRAE